MAQITQILLFSEMSFWRDQRSQFENNTFSKKNCNESFQCVSTLHKKVLSGATMKRVFLYGSNKSDSVVFGNADFREIEYHSLSTMGFSKVF